MREGGRREWCFVLQPCGALGSSDAPGQAAPTRALLEAALSQGPAAMLGG